MLLKPFTTLLAAFSLFSCISAQRTKPDVPLTSGKNKSIEFAMPEVQEPAIPANTVNLTDFGAIADGVTDNSEAFKNAIDAVTKKGGGKVIIPAGIWLTGPIMLKSNLELFTESGALVIFSDNKDLYPVIETSFEGLDTWRCISPIFGKNVENVAFTGKGVWDGNGDAWRFVKRSKLSESQWKKLVASGGIVNEKKDEWYPSEQFRKGMNNADQNVRLDLKTKEEFVAIRDFLRPVMISIQNSKNIMFDGPVFQNSPAWCIHPLMVENLIVRNITVKNPWYSQNGDGIDVESCKNTIIENSHFDVGDDAICIKSGKDEDGRKRGVACENLVIRNNVVYHGHGGVTVGSEMSGGVRNMHVSNCTFIGTDVGLRFKSNRGRGGVVENIFISDVRMTNIPTYAISFNLYYGSKSVSEMLEDGDPMSIPGEEPVDETTPQFKNISIKNITVKGAMQAVLMQGLPEMNLENIEMSDMNMVADNGISVIDATGIQIKNVQLKTKNKTAFEFLNAINVRVENSGFDSDSPSAVTVNGTKTENVSLSSSLKNQTKVGEEVSANGVKF